MTVQPTSTKHEGWPREDTDYDGRGQGWTSWCETCWESVGHGSDFQSAMEQLDEHIAEMEQPRHAFEVDCGGSRVSCLPCLRTTPIGATCLRQPYMNDEQWIRLKAEFFIKHPAPPPV